MSKRKRNKNRPAQQTPLPLSSPPSAPVIDSSVLSRTQFDAMEDQIRGEEILISQQSKKEAESRKVKKQLDDAEVEKRLDQLRKDIGLRKK